MKRRPIVPLLLLGVGLWGCGREPAEPSTPVSACDSDPVCRECGEEADTEPFCGGGGGECTKDSDCGDYGCEPGACISYFPYCLHILTTVCPCQRAERFALRCGCGKGSCAWLPK